MPLKADKKLQHHLKRGGIIAYATESCFGLGCLPTHQHALKKLLKLKQRDASKGMIIIGNNFKQLQPYFATLTHTQRSTLRTTWPAVHTWVVPASEHCSPMLTGKHLTIAARVPAHAQARLLCQRTANALVSTSANLSGKKPIKSYTAALRKFAGRAWVIRGKIGHYRKPSTVQDLLTGQILRK